jgi:hypothetical protein
VRSARIHCGCALVPVNRSQRRHELGLGMALGGRRETLRE